jgi:penicillin-binding protein 1C
VALFALADAVFPFPFERLEPPAATVVRAGDGAALRLFLPADGIWRVPVTLDEVAPELREAVIASEDRWLRWHPGVNPLAVVRAVWTNLRAGRVVSGASTIPMQVARLVERRPRTLTAKLLDAFRALQLRWHLGADEVLEHYLNLAPFGGNLEGVGAATWAYFGKRPGELSLGEAALLTALPRAPNAYDPVRAPAAARRARDRVLAQLARRGVFTAREIDAARRQPLPARRRSVPFEAPHFARWIAAQADGSREIATTLDRRAQRIAEELVAARIPELRQRGITNAAAVVIEQRTRALRALVGSAGFFDAAHQGQVNGALARRSPGSTLKPFLYALAFDLGRIVPETYLLDVPTDYAGYVAQNYDGTYRGRVTAHRALVESLNAPAVRLLARVKLSRFLELLRRGGLTTLDRPAHTYGLPLVLGAGEVTLVDLVNLYATLAEEGWHRPVRATPGPPSRGERLLSPEAAHLTAQILTEVKRPDLPRAWDLARGVPAVAWKTGTSYGHRDAWAVGFSRRLAIGVWVGNLDGRPRQGISGAGDAAPLLFDLFRALDPAAGRLEPPRAPLRVTSTEVCALSHELPGPFCPARVRVATLPGRSRLHACTHHRRVFLDARTGERLAGRCLAARAHRPAVLEVFPAELRAWWRGKEQPFPELPPLHADCRDVPGGDAPRIVSPDAATPYRVRRDAPRDFQQVRLAARAASGTTHLFWYQDGRLIATGRPDAPLFARLEPGRHRLVAVDDTGRSDAIEYRVE